MTKTVSLKVEPRERAGKGSSRATRRAGLVPAVIYGNKKEPEMITIKSNEIVRLLNRGGFMTHIYEIELNGKTQKVLPRDLQLDPVLDFPIHIDFLRIGKNTTVHVEVPLHFLNEDTCPGIKRGGMLNAVRHTVDLVCRADSIPEYLEVDLSNAQMGDSIHISAVTLPEGVHTGVDRDFTIATIAAPGGKREDDDVEDAAEDAAG